MASEDFLKGKKEAYEELLQLIENETFTTIEGIKAYIKGYSDSLVIVKTASGSCPSCKKWPLALKSYDADGYTWRCEGCLRVPNKCRCSR